MTDDSDASAGGRPRLDERAIEYIAVEQLMLDPQNPRLPEELLGANQSSLLSWLEENEALEELASSMITTGFFPQEPLVVSPLGPGRFVVVEGNRRFATISILLQLAAAAEADVEFDFESPPQEWQLDRLRSVPALVVADAQAEEVRKYLGFRHIGGLKTWKPEAKARYLEREVDAARSEGVANVFKEVGRRVGTNALGVRGPYIALKVLRIAQEDEQLASAANHVLRNRFGVWNRLLNSGEVRAFIGFGDAIDFDGVQDALANINVPNLGRVLGDLRPAKGANRAVLQDSRDATRYGQILGNDVARTALFERGDVDLAYQIVDREALGVRLLNYSRAIDVITQSVDVYEMDEEVLGAAQSLSGSARNLLAVVRDRLAED